MTHETTVTHYPETLAEPAEETGDSRYDNLRRSIRIRNAKTGAWYDLSPVTPDKTVVNDLPAIIAICNEPPIYDLLFRERCAGNPYAATDADRFLAWSVRGWRERTHFVYLLRDPSGTVAGAIDIKSANLAAAEIGYWLSAIHSGVMTNAVKAIGALARQAGYAELYALVREGNERSAAVLQRAGFDVAETLAQKERTYTRFVKRLTA